MHFDVGVVKRCTGMCIGLFEASLTHSWFMEFVNAVEDRNEDSAIEPNPFSPMLEMRFAPESLLGLMGKWLFFLPILIVASILKLALTVIKIAILTVLSVIIMLVSLPLAVRLKPRNSDEVTL